MHVLRKRVTHDGMKNASIQITGEGDDFEWEEILSPKDLSPTPRHFKIDAIHYAVSDKAEIWLAWKSGEEIHPVLPLSGRGKLDFAEVGGLHATTNGDDVGIALCGANLGLFTIILDLSKHVGER